MATGPHDDKLRVTAGPLHYELRRVGIPAGNKPDTYELGIFEDDELLDKKIKKTKDYGAAATWAIHEFMKVVNRDRNIT